MDLPNTRASNCEEENEDSGTIVSDTELSDLSDSSVPQETCTNALSVCDGADQPNDPPNSQSPEFEWISSYDKPDPSQIASPSQKRPRIDDWSDDECSVSKSQRGRRQEYRYEDKKAIVDYISQTNSYNKVKGRQLWETMADTKVCPGRTWQSLKEHYTKQIIPNISIFHLPKNIEKLYLAPFPRYRPKKHVHFEDNNLKRPENEFKKNGGNTGARQLADPPLSFDSDEHSDIELSELSLRKGTEPPELSPSGTPEWLSAGDDNESSEDSREKVPEGSQNKFSDIYAENILKLIGNADSIERPPNSSSEIDSSKDEAAIDSENPELLSSEAPTEKERSINVVETERTQITNRPPATEERSLDEYSVIECIPDLPSCDDEVTKLPISDVTVGEMKEANSTDTEKPQVADSHITAEERSSDESSEAETIPGVPRRDEGALILPIRKRICMNRQLCTSQRTEQSTTVEATPQRTEQSTTVEAKPLTPSKWPSMKIVQKSSPYFTVRKLVTTDESAPSEELPVRISSPYFTVRKSVTTDESAPSEELPFRTKRREYTYEDKKAIVNYISQTESYNRVKGRQFWQTMVDHKVCPGRTWQSLKEHYIKQIIPNLCIFRLTEEEEKKFLAPFV